MQHNILESNIIIILESNIFEAESDSRLDNC